MNIWKKLFGGGSKPPPPTPPKHKHTLDELDVLGAPPAEEKQREKLVSQPLDNNSELIAKKLYRLQQYTLTDLAERNPIRVIIIRAEVQSLLLSEFQLQVDSVKEAEGHIRDVGAHLCENGGFDRMVLIAHQVQALGGSLRQLEYSWNGICGWRS